MASGSGVPGFRVPECGFWFGFDTDGRSSGRPFCFPGRSGVAPGSREAHNFRHAQNPPAAGLLRTRHSASVGRARRGGPRGTDTGTYLRRHAEPDVRAADSGHYREADAVFSGEVRELTVERATIAVIETWKGELAPEVAMPTGVTRNQDGTFTIHGEAFSFGKSQKYILFGFGTPAKGKLVDSLSTSSCEPNVDLARAGATIAVLDAIVGGPQRPRSAQNEPVVPFEEVVACAAAGTCRNLKPGVLGWFDSVGNRVNQFSRDGFTYSVAAAGSLLRVWIALPGEARATRLLTLGAGGRLLRAEMGPIPGEGGPRRMSADELESWRRAHKVYVAADAPGSGWVGGDEFFPFWQEQSARAWNAIQRQFNAPQETRAAAFETLVACVSTGTAAMRGLAASTGSIRSTSRSSNSGTAMLSLRCVCCRAGEGSASGSRLPGNAAHSVWYQLARSGRWRAANSTRNPAPGIFRFLWRLSIPNTPCGQWAARSIEPTNPQGTGSVPSSGGNSRPSFLSQ